VYKEDQTQTYDPGRTSHTVHYNKTHKSGLEYEIKHKLYKVHTKTLLKKQIT